MAGEAAQDLGRDGLHRAKRWLDMTTRVDKSWTHGDRGVGGLLEFAWPNGKQSSFSYDLGGTFRGGELNGQSFLAEVKKYKQESDLPIHYRAFLAKCYVAFQAKPDLCDNFLWISWAPFQAGSWDQHTSIETVTRALVSRENRDRALGATDEEDAKRLLDAETLVEVSRRVWLLTLCDEQEQLVLMPEHYVEVVGMITREKVW